MKNLCFVLLSCLLMLGIMGCQDNHVSWSKEQICLNFEGQQSCIPNKGGGYLLTLKDGKPVLKSLETTKGMADLTFPQYAAAQLLVGERMSVIVENGKLVLQEGAKRFVDDIGLGLLLLPEAKGQMQLMTPVNAEIVSKAIRIDSTGAIAGSNPPIRRLQLIQPLSAEGFMALTRIAYVVGGDKNHYIPNDTGTEVIIIDNFHVVGSCSAEAPDSCCPAGESVGGTPPDISGWMSEYAAEGQKLLACFPAGSICTFTAGDKLIVIQCESQERYCLNLSSCPVTITTTEEEGICFSIPLECSMENPFN